jgi:hypothetical protein
MACPSLAEIATEKEASAPSASEEAWITSLEGLARSAKAVGGKGEEDIAAPAAPAMMALEGDSKDSEGNKDSEGGSKASEGSKDLEGDSKALEGSKDSEVKRDSEDNKVSEGKDNRDSEEDKASRDKDNKVSEDKDNKDSEDKDNRDSEEDKASRDKDRAAKATGDL